MKKTLIIPCAGKSNRFPNMKPKWMLTHPDGKLMIEKSIKGLNLDIFDRIIITIVKPHDEKYEASLILKQVFKSNSKIEICLLDDFTDSASETIYLTLKKMNVEGAFVIKDSDNYVCVNIPTPIQNSITGYDLHKHPEITKIAQKSFLLVNKGVVLDIIEKQIVSNTICIGVYAFENAELFKKAYESMKQKEIKGEMYISHIISHIISQKEAVFQLIEATNYEDWGTLDEWEKVQKNHRTYFCDVDGILIKNCGKYGSKNWYNNKEVLLNNINIIRSLQEKGAQIIITTSRPAEFKKNLEKLLNKYGIFPYAILTGLNHTTRVLINDFAPTNPYPSGIAISLPRNANVGEYLRQ